MSLATGEPSPCHCQPAPLQGLSLVKGFAILPAGGIELISSLIEQVVQHQALCSELCLARCSASLCSDKPSGDEAPSLRPHGSESRE